MLLALLLSARWEDLPWKRIRNNDAPLRDFGNNDPPLRDFGNNYPPLRDFGNNNAPWRGFGNNDFAPFNRASLSPYPNSYKNPDGSLSCMPGFISNGPIDARGCWKCNKTCARSAICAYPGVCFVPVPRIVNIELKKDVFMVTFHIQDIENFQPLEAFCRFGNGPVSNAISVTHETAACPVDQFFEDSFARKQLQISFDREMWSKSLEQEEGNGSETTETNENWRPTTIAAAVIGVIAIVIVIVIVVIKKRGSQTAPRKIEMIEQNMPIAFFPQVKDSATPKYNEMIIDPRKY